VVTNEENIRESDANKLDLSLWEHYGAYTVFNRVARELRFILSANF